MTEAISSRKQASAKTAIWGVILHAVTVLAGFISQRIFINTLGIEYVGITGTFTSIVSILTLADLGISTAVIFHLYKPLAKHDEKRVAALMQYYHKACRIITTIIIGGGLIMLPLAPSFIGESTVDTNLYLVFGLFIVNAAFSYAINYRRPLLAADQKGYIINGAMTVGTLLQYGLKIAILLTTQNYYLFILCGILAKIVENLILNRIVAKRYPYITERAVLDKKTKKDLQRKMRATAYHNTAAYVVFSTDNIIISKIFGVAWVGLYANYYMVINSLSLLLEQIFGAMRASLGNLLIAEGAKKLYVMTKRLMLFNFLIYAVVGIAMYYCLTPFISLWLGAEYLFTDVIVVILVLNFYLRGMGISVFNSLMAAGIMYENRFVPIAEALINLVVSIVLALLIGLPGVFIGTVVSNLFLHLYSYPKYAFELVFKRKRSEYVGLFLKYLSLFVLAWAGVGVIINLIHMDNNWLTFLVNGLIAVAASSLFYWLLFRKTDDFQYFARLARDLISRKVLKRR